MSHITKKDIEVGLKDREDFITMVARKKYCHQGESSFQDVIERVVQEFTKVSKHTPEENESVASLLRDGKFIPAGSILYGLGNTEVRCSLSNCYLIKIEEDSLEGIFEAQKKMARTFAMRGGSGVDITVLRPKNTKVDNAARTSSGAVSFMPLFSEVTQTIGQMGRRGASLVSLDIRHPDALDFIWSKANPERVFGKDNLTGRVPDISGANISLKVTDAFMKAYENNEDWEFIFPDIEADKERYNKEWDGDYDKWLKNHNPIKSFGKVPARDIFAQICEANWSCGDPGMMFIGTMQRNDPASVVHESLIPMGTNPCFTGDMELDTFEGPKKFSDLSELPSVLVRNPSGGCTVGRVWSNGIKDTVKISFHGKGTSKYAPITVTPDHVFMLNDGSSCMAKDLLGKRVAVPLYGHFTQHKKDTAMAGFLFGDGILTDMLNSSKKGITVCIGKDDEDVASLFGVEVTQDYHHYSREWRELADKFRLVPCTISERRIPDTIAFEDIFGFLCGVYSANGSICGDRVTLKTTSKGLATDVVEVLASMGISAYVTASKAKEVVWPNGVYTGKESYDVN